MVGCTPGPTTFSRWAFQAPGFDCISAPGMWTVASRRNINLFARSSLTAADSVFGRVEGFSEQRRER
jgi:hypothetical protein